MPDPRQGESRSDFIDRCMGDAEAAGDFPEPDQRLAFCSSQFDRKRETNQMNKIIVNVIVSLMKDLIRHETLNGTPHLVVPAVMAVECVMNDLFYPSDELAMGAPKWNGRPIPINHPVDEDGNFITCNDPEVMREQVVGIIFNAKQVGKRLLSELWIDIAKCNQVSPGVIEGLENGEGLELSTGLRVDLDKTPGSFEGNSFEAVARNHEPDHLALLPNNEGACSWADGCGCPRNSLLVMNQLSFSDIHRQIHGELEKKFNIGPNDFLFVKDIFDTFVVFERPGDESKLMQQDFTIEDDQVKLTDDAFEVRENRSFTKVQTQNNAGSADQGGDGNANQGDSAMDRQTRVNALIEGPSGWSEDDREFLTNAKDAQFDKIEKHVTVAAGNDDGSDGDGTGSGSDEPTGAATATATAPAATATPTGDGDGAGDDAGDATPAPAPATAAAPAAPATTATPAVPAAAPASNQAQPPVVTLNDHLNGLPQEAREAAIRGIDTNNQMRANLVSRIQANSRNPYTVEELNAKGFDELEKLAALSVQTDYSGRILPAPGPVEDPNKIPATPVINWKKAAGLPSSN